MRYDGRDLEAMSCAKGYYNWIMDEFRPFLGQDVVEVGAGVGNFSQWLLAANPHSFTAVEPSANLFPLLQQALANRPNVVACNAFFREARRTLPHQPDTVFYINVLEHIRDDRGELESVYEALKAGGHVCIFVPALQWLYGSIDAAFGHERRYHKPALVSLVRSVGFEVRNARYFDLAGVVPWWILARVLRGQLKPGSVSLYDRVVVPITRAIERRITPPLGKNLLLVGKKR